MVPHHCRRIGAALGLVLVCAAAGCDMPAADPAPDPPAAEGAPEPATPLVPLNLEEAVNRAVDAAFAQYAKNPVAHAVTIAPVVNGITGEQSAATRKIADGIAARLRQNAGMLDITPFGADALGEKPYVVFASFTPRAADDKTEDTGTGYRLCLAVRDGGDGRLVGAATALVRADGVDPTPLRFFRDSPVWVRPTGPGTRRDTCDPSAKDARPWAGDTVLLERLAITSQAIDDYEAGRAPEAETLFRRAAEKSEGGAIDALNGLYLVATKRGQQADKAAAFADLVRVGLQSNAFAIKLQFRPDSKGFVERPGLAETYGMWLGQIAQQAVPLDGCLRVTGHTHTERNAPFSRSLSLARAHAVQDRLEQAQPSLRGRVVAAGAGDTKPLIGNQANNASDALDRRITIQKWPSCEGLVPPDD